MRPSLELSISVFLVAIAGPATAEVVAAQADGLQVRETATIAATPARVYAALGRIGFWWSSAHTFSGDSRNLHLDLKAGGCMCEQLPGGGSALHQTVVYADPGKHLRLTGGLGPMQQFAAAGVTDWSIQPAPGGSKVVLSYSIGGYAPGGLAMIAPAVDGVLAEQLARLKSYVQTGRAPATPRAPG